MSRLSEIFPNNIKTSDIRLVQRGTCLMSGTGSYTKNQTIPTSLLNLNKAFLVFSVLTQDSDVSGYMVSGSISSTSIIRFNRVNAGNDVVIYWQIIEYN